MEENSFREHSCRAGVRHNREAINIFLTGFLTSAQEMEALVEGWIKHPWRGILLLGPKESSTAKTGGAEKICSPPHGLGIHFLEITPSKAVGDLLALGETLRPAKF